MNIRNLVRTLREKAGHAGHQAPCLSTCSSLHDMAEALGNAVDARDARLYRHSRDVADIACVLGHGLGMNTSAINTIHVAGHLHDIGKIGLPDSILNKKGPLNEEEWQWIRRHPDIGAGIVSPVPALNQAGGVADIIRHHHERFDGKGYPRGLKADNIPLGARIMAVADTLSALLSDRCYRRGCSFDDACAEINRCSGSQFDPVVVRSMKCNRDMIRRRLLESGNADCLPVIPFRIMPDMRPEYANNTGLDEKPLSSVVTG